MLVTTSLKGASLYSEEAQSAASLLGGSYVARKNMTEEELFTKSGKEPFLMIGSKGPTLCTPEGEKHFFHLSMAKLRLLEWKRSQKDHLVEAVASIVPLGEGIKILDATLGLGSDSAVLSYAYGEDAEIIGLEGYRPLAYITNYGCRHYNDEDEDVTAALRCIQVANLRYESYLKNAKTDSMDIVYIDPMFTVPVQESPQFKALRSYVVESSLDKDIFKEACRVAKRGVVIKERSFSTIFDALGIVKLYGGKYSRIRYGVYEL